MGMMDRLSHFKLVGVVDNEQSDLMDRLRDKVIQHNIGVVASYYNRISTKRLSQFLSIDIAKTEHYVSRMVTENELLNAWKADTDKLLDLVDLTCHQIHKEMVIHKAKNKGNKKARK